MAITYPLALPSEHLAEAAISVNDVVSVSRSPFTLREQVQEFPGDAWAAEISLPRMRRADAAPWIAWLTALRGRLGTFLLGDPIWTEPLGAGGVGVMAVDSPSGRTIATDGWVPSTEKLFLAGDVIQVGTGADARLYRILEDVDSDGSGAATLSIWPRWRHSTSGWDGDAITTLSPKGRFRLASNERLWRYAPGRSVVFAPIPCVEAP